MLRSDYVVQKWTGANEQNQDTEALFSTHPEGFQIHTNEIIMKDLNLCFFTRGTNQSCD